MLSDLEADHLNPYDASKRVNAWVDLELGLHVCLSLLLLLSGKWLMLVLTLPLVAIDAHERYKKQHKVEPVTVFRNINRSRNVRVAKLLIAIVCFSFAIYRFVSLLAVNVVGAKQNRNGRRGGKAKVICLQSVLLACCCHPPPQLPWAGILSLGIAEPCGDCAGAPEERIKEEAMKRIPYSPFVQ